MLNILEVGAQELTTLRHGKDVFHAALEKVREGETRFHVRDEEGRVPDYDLAYTENSMLFPEQVRKLIAMMTNGGKTYASFLDYDEEKTDQMCLEFLTHYDKIEVESIDEYSVAVVRAALSLTRLPVFSADARILWFFAESEQLHVVDSLPAAIDPHSLRITPSPFEMGYTKRDWSYLASVAAFQNLFVWQAFTLGKSGPFKYAEVSLSRITGIGGILSHTSMISNAMGKKGLSTYLRPGCTRYPEKLLCKYFHINPKPSDATDDNTLVLDALMSVFSTSWFCNQSPASFDESILDEGFAAEMREYADAVLGGRKVLGVLSRGTDYVTTNLGGDRIHATADQMITVIRQWMEDAGYEKIFLATEDQDIFERMKAEFPGDLIAIAQERMSVSDMRKKGSTLIYDFEQKANEGQAYEDALEDTTVNYFYALYILSRCDAFLCSGQCNGWDTVLSLNGGKFERTRKLMVGINGDPLMDDWKEIRPITAGMFARGAYPATKAFFMTFRFDLKEKVDPEAVRKAWEQTLAVYPYMGYAVGMRKNRLVFLENPLPFVFEETGEIVEPFERKGNFHAVTFCYLGNTLWIYADHVPTDETGFRMVLETFFYHYYCALDAREYPVPDGVHTCHEGALPGQEEDAYRMVDAIDPAAMMSRYSSGETFVIREAVRDELFPTKEDCRGYCISVPSAELMEYAKSIGGSPMSVLAAFSAKAIMRVHPENTLPIEVMSPVSVRNVMGNRNSLLHQVVHANYQFSVEDLKEKDDRSLNAAYRAFLKGFSSEQNIRTLCGVYRGICEGYAKAFAANKLDSVILETRAKTKPGISVSYLGTLRTGDYGSRIRMTAFHVMQEKGIMLQTTEVGNTFYIDWYQGHVGDAYAKAMRDVMFEAGMKGVCLERVE